MEYFKGHCAIGNKAEIKDGEIHTIHEGLHQLNSLAHLSYENVYLCVDNQNALRALLVRPTAGREYVKECLKETQILCLKGCRIQGKWTPSHQDINGTEQADTAAKAGLEDLECQWTRTTLSWLRAQSRQRMITGWKEERNPDCEALRAHKSPKQEIRNSHRQTPTVANSDRQYTPPTTDTMRMRQRGEICDTRCYELQYPHQSPRTHPQRLQWTNHLELHNMKEPPTKTTTAILD